jgi:mRNA-degrading endonuclease RelE of RelBE toxin-antitoxin system
MKTRVELDPQVVEFVRGLTPEPRKLVRRGLRGLVDQRGDLKQLEGALSDSCRLRVAGYRIIVRLYADRGRPVARCVFAERRSIVYEIFGDILSRTRG